MGQMRFLMPQPERLAVDAPQRAYMAGQEGIPWECRVTCEEGLLTVEREERESGNLYFPWLVRGRGEIMLSTASLMERARPYNLPVELARGTVNRVRNQSYLWQGAGMALPDKLPGLLHEASESFSHAATSQNDPLAAAEHADAAIRHGLDAAELLGNEYTRQVLAVRRSQQSPLGTLLGCKLTSVPEGSLSTNYLAAFNTAVLAPAWNEIEPQAGTRNWDLPDRQMQWAKDSNLRVCFGPLLQIDRLGLPDWLYLYEDDFDEMHATMLQHVEAVVMRYRGRVSLWHVAARVNAPGGLQLAEEQRLKLTVDAIDCVRNLDGRTPTFVSFDQPLAEYIATKDQELTPLHFADTLVRGELGLAGIGVELNWGYWPHGTLPRDTIEIGRQLDRWTHLGLPLVVALSAASSSDADALARPDARPLAQLVEGGITPASQRDLVEWLLPMLLAKPSIQAIVWNQFRDDLPHGFPHAGLIDPAGHPKPALQSLLSLRQEWLA